MKELTEYFWTSGIKKYPQSKTFTRAWPRSIICIFWLSPWPKYLVNWNDIHFNYSFWLSKLIKCSSSMFTVQRYLLSDKRKGLVLLVWRNVGKLNSLPFMKCCLFLCFIFYICHKFLWMSTTLDTFSQDDFAK